MVITKTKGKINASADNARINVAVYTEQVQTTINKYQ